MAKATSNPLLKFGVPTLAFVLVFAGISAMKTGTDENAEGNQEEVVYDLTKEEKAELGMADGDTSFDTIRTLLAQARNTRKDVEAVKEQNKILIEENNKIRDRADALRVQLEKKLESASTEVNSEAMNEELKAMKAEFQTQLDQLKNQVASTPVEPSFPIKGGFDDYNDPNALTWVNPSDMPMGGDDLGGFGIGGLSNKREGEHIFATLDRVTGVGDAKKNLTGRDPNYQKQNQEPVPPTPFFTLPRNSTLMGSTSMTALIGRVPIGDTLTDPFPFKVIIGAENLMANGIDLPDVEGAIVAGKASGDWTLSCVKAKVQDITFLFKDGRMMTFPEETDGNNETDEDIGYLSTPSGIPCIPGERKTNAPQFLATQFFLATAGGASQGLAQSQLTQMAEGGSTSSALTGDIGKFAIGAGVSEGITKVVEWNQERYGKMFDAVYVAPAQKVAVNITKTIKIDYDLYQRKVKYYHNAQQQQLD